MVLVQVLHDFYNERLEPLDHHVMRELEARTGSRTCLQELSKLAGITPGVRMKESSYNQFWLYLDGLEPNFVDQRSPVDPYPADLWWALQNLASSEDLGRSRFECAKLIRRRLPYHLGSRCLGEICHIVELAVRKHKVLGYREGLLVAFTRSLEYEKREQAGVQRRGHHAPDRDPLPVASWETLRRGMQELFVASGGSIALSSLKTLFRERLQTLLSETALEHTKLSAVFQDPRLTDVCRLMARGPEKFVVSVAAAGGGPEAWDIAQLKSARRSKTRSAAQRRQQTTASGSRSESCASSEEDGEDAEEAEEGEAEGFAEALWAGDGEAAATAAAAAWGSDAARWLGEAEA